LCKFPGTILFGAALREGSTGGIGLATAEYHLKQAKVAAKLALAESDPVKARSLHLLALEHYDKAEKEPAGVSATIWARCGQ
jgi:hypothetical protein